MKTTLDLPDELIRSIKLRAVREDRTLKDLVAELLRLGLAAEPAQRIVRRRVKLPLIEGGHPAPPDRELTPDRVAAILMDEEVEHLVR